MASKVLRKTFGASASIVVAILLCFMIAALPRAEAYASDLAAGESQLSAQSSSIYITSPSDGASFAIGDQITVTAYANIYFFQWGYPATNYITFKVTQNGKKVHYASDYYNSAGATLYTSFIPKSPGKYKIEISGSRFSQPSYEDFEATDSITITVKKASSFKSVVPTVRSQRVSKKRVEISWDAAGTGAKIYRSTERNGKYKLIKTTKDTSYVDKVSAKKNYFYKIRLYLTYDKKTYLSKYSNVESKFSKKPAKPKSVKAKKTKKGVKLTWKQSKDCGHFTILRSTKKKGKYEVVGYIAGDAKTSYVDKTVKKGKKYYYKIEADNYMDWSGEIKGARSAAVKVKA